ncbi:magnesium/cobalt transporter CorA [Flavobacterium nackdongense]|uniref:Magnesium transport protein CorA n=1 Tax=Flavobacterium nackdongense TaxID=2547394 RepID=A0A4P6Y636_9FLAO|nr:magnesium/cobalt transporter CorA [Flavobacterium nackdongense]QBN17731.1 magnesium/cobalt transporter CorA [Flavobacterium nackdongense]
MRKIKYKKGRRLQQFNLEYTGIHKRTDSEMQLFVYDQFHITEYQQLNFSDLENSIDVQKTNWINVHGLNDLDLIKNMGRFFKVEDYMLADILNTNRRTKIEEQHDLLFFNIKSLLPAGDSETISAEQISFLIKEGVLISFQEKRSDFFTHIRDRLRAQSGIIRTKKADFLLYVLLDAIMENFYITIENEEDKIDELINLTKSNAGPIVLERIEQHRDNFNFLKRAITPLRDSLYDIKSMKDDNVFNAIEEDNFSFFARLHQKSLELLEQIESDMSSLHSASDFYFSAQNHNMNEIMKTLTVVSAIFIPLTFIVGVYGMNFEFMPELKYEYGYYTVIGGMALIVLGMLYYFKKRNWF